MSGIVIPGMVPLGGIAVVVAMTMRPIGLSSYGIQRYTVSLGRVDPTIKFGTAQ
jgi:hypothetical protein